MLYVLLFYVYFTSSREFLCNDQQLANFIWARSSVFAFSPLLLWSNYWKTCLIFFSENGGPPAYDKTKSFFDNISCEAMERSKGRPNRPDWKAEKQLNRETFGATGFNRRNYNQVSSIKIGFCPLRRYAIAGSAFGL